MNRESLSHVDPELFSLLERESERQECTLNLVASENFVSDAVLAASGSVLINNYAEGLPGKRYYGGCEIADEVERLAIERAAKLFEVPYVNVQPHAASQAIQAVYEALLEPGDAIMGMELSHGGHVAHGSSVSFSGKHYRVVSYGVRSSDQRVDEDQVRDLARNTRPKLIICGASAYSRIIDARFFRTIADEVGAELLADVSHVAGLIAGGHYPSPATVRALMIAATHKTLRGPRGGVILGPSHHGAAIDRALFPGLQGGAHMHSIAAKAVAFHEASLPAFREYTKRIIDNAQSLSDALIAEGFSIVSGGTDTHLMILDLRTAKISGDEAQKLLDSVGIVVNMNMIPYDPQPPSVCSGIRIGTPALTTRGFMPADMPGIASLIRRALEARGEHVHLRRVRDDVRMLAASFPLYSTRPVDHR